MRKIALILACMFSFGIVYAQTFSDANDYYPSPGDEIIRNEILQTMKTNLKSGSVVAEVPAGILYFRVKFHVVTKLDGSGGLDIAILPEVMSMLNQAFRPANIQFVSCLDVNYIRNDTIYILPSGKQKPGAIESREKKLWNEYDVADAINIFFYSDNSHRGISWGSIISIQNSNALVAVPHEMGHSFNLGHTFQERKKFINGDTIIVRENVARSGEHCNCETEGDKFCDTEAEVYDSLIAPLHLWDLFSSPEFTFSGTYYDIYGDKYKPDVKNLMSYYFVEDRINNGTLISHFSHQQNVFMRIYADKSWSANLKTTPIADKIYSTNTTLSAATTEPVILQNITINSPATLTVDACETLIEGTLLINTGSTLKIQ